MRYIAFLLCLFLATPCWATASRSFDGSNDRIGVGTIGASDADFEFGSGDFTLAFWVYATAWNDGASRGICGKKLTDGSTGWLIYNDGGSGTKIDARLLLTNNFFTATSVTTNTWQHWALTRSGSTVKWYLNGVEDASGTNSSILVGLIDTTYIGFNETHSGYFSGRLAYFSAYKGKALSVSEITQVMKMPGSVVDSLVAHLTLLGDSPELDLSGLGNSGTLTETSTSTDGPPIFLTTGMTQ